VGLFEVIVSGVDDGWKEGENSVSNMGLVLVHSRAVSLILLPRELWFLFGILSSSSGRGNGRAGLRGRLCFSFCLLVSPVSQFEIICLASLVGRIAYYACVGEIKALSISFDSLC
jgi:hypothetical protein